MSGGGISDGGSASGGLKVAAVQYEPRLFARDENTAALLRLAAEAAAAGADLIVLPEMAATGYCFRDRDEIAPYVEPIPGPTTRVFGEFARQRGISLVLGLPEVDPDSGAFYNSAVLIDPSGAVAGHYRKTHSFHGDIRWAAEGDLGLPVFEAGPVGPLGLLICMDGGFFETARVLALGGARLIAFPANWLRPAPSPEWRARAAENGVYLVAANRWGEERGVRFAGGSCVIGPDGAVRASVKRGDGVALAIVELARPDPTFAGLVTRRPELYHDLLRHSYLWPETYVFGDLGSGPFWLGVVTGGDAAGGRPAPLERPAFALPGPPGRRVLAVAPPPETPGCVAPPPETPDCVTPPRETPGPVAVLADKAVALGAYLAATTERPGEVVLVGPDGPVGGFRSPHLSGSDWSGADRGNAFPVFDLPFARVGLLNSLDLLLPEPARILAKKGADCILAVGPWPQRAKHLTFLWEERAVTNDILLAVASHGDAGLFTGGGRGERLEPLEGPGFAGAYGETSPGSFTRRKDRLRRLRPDLYRPLVAP